MDARIARLTQGGLALAHALAGLLLIGFAALFYGVAGWGIGFDDITDVFDLAPLPWLGLLAIPRLLQAWRSGGPRRRLASWLLVACVAAAACTLVLHGIAQRACVEPELDEGMDPGVRCPVTPVWALPIGLVWITLGRLGLAIPVLVAWERHPGWRVAAVLLFVMGAAVAMAPATSGALGLYVVLRVAVAVLAGLGLALLALAWADVRSLRRRPA